MSNEATCATCRYSRQTGALEQGRPLIGTQALVCRRFPPQPMVTGGGGQMNVTPLPVPVSADHWCGEHAPRLAS